MTRSFLVAIVCLCFGIACISAFNPDRTIYKWSPLWFNNYIRRAILHKRFRDEPITKWSPATFRANYFKRDGCARENAICSFTDEVTGDPMDIPCCGDLQCIPTGDYYSCSYAGYRNNYMNEVDYIYE